jgi:acetyl esterase/lipase
VVHGGSWKSGSNAELPNVNDYFSRAGYAVASINYRLASQAKSPAPQEDVALAFRWLKAHAAELSIDTTAFVLMGRSAGGQIVLTAADSLQEPGLRGVISFYGPTDMLFAWNDPHNQAVMRHRDVLSDFFGGTPETVRQRYIEGSPVAYVTSKTVPTLMVHGMLDQHVHYRESELLDSVLQSAGVPHMLLGLPWATHGCEYSLNGPSGQLAVYAAERFINTVTQKKPTKRR